jgi:NAD(P)H-flavin reductase
MLHEALARSGNWREHDVYASGPTPMVEAAANQLTALGVPEGREPCRRLRLD